MSTSTSLGSVGLAHCTQTPAASGHSVLDGLLSCSATARTLPTLPWLVLRLHPSRTQFSADPAPERPETVQLLAVSEVTVAPE